MLHKGLSPEASPRPVTSSPDIDEDKLDIPKHPKLERFLRNSPGSLANMIVGWLELYATDYFDDTSLKQVVAEAIEMEMNTINSILNNRVIEGELMRRADAFNPKRDHVLPHGPIHRLSPQEKAQVRSFFAKFKEHLKPVIKNLAEQYAAARRAATQSKAESAFKQSLTKEVVAAMNQVDIIIGRTKFAN